MVDFREFHSSKSCKGIFDGLKSGNIPRVNESKVKRDLPSQNSIFRIVNFS